MKPLQVYHKLLRLHYSNKKILDLYQDLLVQLKDDQEEKDIINSRMEVRKCSDLELCKMLLLLTKNKNKSLPDTLLERFLTQLVAKKFYLQHLFVPVNLNSCHRCERKNLGLYYETICSGKLPKNVLNLLLEQKSRVENYLIHEH